ncbi:MAG: proline iminopeptidase-family hydrolase [Bacteroidota bacterium]
MRFTLCAIGALLFFLACTPTNETTTTPDSQPSLTTYHDNSDRPDRFTGGISMVPIQTAIGEFRVYTKRMGNNPDIKLLLLHGGPGATHEYFLSADSYLPTAGVEYYYYDQLGSFLSDRPDDSSLWTIDRFVDEVEQVREALGLGPDNFYLLGHSWGGILAMEYALAHQDQLKGLIISNMMSDCPAYGKYAHEVLGPGLGDEIYQQIVAFEEAEDFGNPEYLRIMEEIHYPKHVLRMPPEEWPAPVINAFAHLNPDIYVPMQGPSEFGIRGSLENWSVTDRLQEIEVPTLVIAGQHDTMDPEHMRMMAEELPQGQLLMCENGSHMAMYDDQETYYQGLIDFLQRVDDAQ